MAWLSLLIAGIFEIVWAVGLKYTDGFTRVWPSIGTVAAMLFSFFFLAQSLRHIPLGTAYAVWTGIGVVGTALLGMVFFDESRDVLRVGCILLIITGILGLKFASS